MGGTSLGRVVRKEGRVVRLRGRWEKYGSESCRCLEEHFRQRELGAQP